MELPVLTAIRALRKSRDGFALALLYALAIYSAVVLAVPLSSGAAALAMRRFHGAGWSFAGWAMLQPLPWMYNFENRFSITYARSGQPQCSPRSEVVNHQPYGKLVTPYERYWYQECGGARVRFSSTYRGLTIETGYSVEPAPQPIRGLLVHPSR